MFCAGSLTSKVNYTMNRFRSTRLPPALLLALGSVIIPLLAALIGEQMLYGSRYDDIAADYVIDLNYDRSDNRLEGAAPARTELAVYLNDSLLDVVRANGRGRFSTDLYSLPERRNRLVALPTEIDPSTLAVFYLAKGFQEHWVAGRPREPEPPFLASATLHDGTLEVYGSTEPSSDVEICLDACAGGQPTLSAKSDDEGSFRGEVTLGDLSVETMPPLSSRIRYTGDQDWKEFETPLQPALVELEPASASPLLFERAISLTLSPTDVVLAFEVTMPTGYKVYGNLVQGDISALEFVEYIFGEVTLNTYLDPRQLAWRQERQGDSQRVRVLIESEPLPFLIPGDATTVFQLRTSALFERGIPLYNSQDQIEVALKDTRLVQSNLLPTESEEGRLSWVGALTRDKRTLTLWVNRSPQADLDPIDHFKLRDTLSDQLEEVFPKLTDYPLRETLEGEIVGLLPDQVPNPVRAQAYDFYRDLYLSDPLTTHQANMDTFHTFLRGVPGRVPDSIETMLFGGLWLIPSALLLWTLKNHKEQRDFPDRDRDKLALVGWGAVILVLLSLDWLPFLGELSRDAYITWLVAAYVMFLLLTKATLLTRLNSIPALILVAALSLGLTWGLAVLLPILPDAGISFLLTALPLLNFASLAWWAARMGTGERKRPSGAVLALTLIIILGLSIPIQALSLYAQLRRSFGVFSTALALLRPLLPAVVLLATVMILRRRFDRPIGTTLKPLERGLGRVLFVAFVVGLSPSWSFIPVAAILSLILFEWIIPPQPLASSQRLSKFVREHHAQAVRDLLDLNSEGRLLRATERNLQKQIKEGKLAPEDYEKRRQEHRERMRQKTHPDFMQDLPDLSVRDLAFSFGPGPRRWDNARQALAWGVLLLVPLLSLHGWSFVVTEIEGVLPFPFLDIGVRLGLFVIQYLAMAVFLGYFYPYLRGRNGLEKGGLLGGLVILSLLPVHLLMSDSAADLPALLIWAGTVLAFNVLLGVVAFDLKTLFDHGYGWERLTDLYNFRQVIVYLTGSGAPFVATIASAVGGSLDDLVPAVLKVVFPALTLSESQNELLQMLLDLVKRITGA